MCLHDPSHLHIQVQFRNQHHSNLPEIKWNKTFITTPFISFFVTTLPTGFWKRLSLYDNLVPVWKMWERRIGSWVDYYDRMRVNGQSDSRWRQTELEVGRGLDGVSRLLSLSNCIWKVHDSRNRVINQLILGSGQQNTNGQGPPCIFTLHKIIPVKAHWLHVALSSKFNSCLAFKFQELSFCWSKGRGLIKVPNSASLGFFGFRQEILDS